MGSELRDAGLEVRDAAGSAIQAVQGNAEGAEIGQHSREAWSELTHALGNIWSPDEAAGALTRERAARAGGSLAVGVVVMLVAPALLALQRQRMAGSML